MTSKQLEKAKANLRAFQDSKISLRCNKCGYGIKSAFVQAGAIHKDCGGEFIKEE